MVMLTEFRRRTVAAAALLPAVALVSVVLSGCATVSYLGQAGAGQWALMHGRRPIEQVLADPAASEALKRRLRLVQDAREFSVHELGLPDNRSYRSYADLRRDAVVWNVVAAPEFSVVPLNWCFPVAGCVSYRGYFQKQQAQRFAAQLRQRGNDTLVEGVAAYSTLGHFADPVLSTMMRYSDLELVGTIFHELAHQTVYVAGDTEFNESFAMTVETEGLRRWLKAHGRGAELAGFVQQEQFDEQVAQGLDQTRQQLAALYAGGTDPGARRLVKQQLLQRAGQRVLEQERATGLHSGYDGWIAQGLNNAHLAAVGTYFGCTTQFNELLQRVGGQLPAFYAAVRSLRHKPAARAALCGST